MIIGLIYFFILVYMEVVFHFWNFGMKGMNPLLGLSMILVIASAETLITGCVPKKRKKLSFWIMEALVYILFMVQSVYFRIFRMPLLVGAAVIGGGDALTNYFSLAVDGFVHSLPLLLVLALPLVLFGIFSRKKEKLFPVYKQLGKLRCGLAIAVSFIICIMVLQIGKYVDAAYYEEYHEFYDPISVEERCGVTVMVQRDMLWEIQSILSKITGKEFGAGSADEEPPVITEKPQISSPVQVVDPNAGKTEPTTVPDGEGSEEIIVEEPPKPDTSPNAWDIDYEKLASLSTANKEVKWLAEYIAQSEPTRRNAFTGKFKGYNLIFLTAEGFSTYAMDPELTPTLYKLSHSGFVFNNYYTPLWQTSTSDGEYINNTGLIPDGQFSMRKSADNDMCFSMSRFFATEGVYNMAYHDNSLSYYDRYRSHPNLGFDFKACKLGDLSEAEWGKQIFPMEHPGYWPASDYEMMQGTVPEYMYMDRFHVYYMTVSGHMNYNFSGNRMSSKNKEAVAFMTDRSENYRAYKACHIELDKALEYLIDQLEQAGQLDNTLIVLSTDHYPYGMTDEQYEELAGKDLSKDLDKFRNTLILWNNQIQEPIVVDKVCGPMDLMPTLLNLFGFDYDSRMYAGRDIFSDVEGMVIFNDRSFVTDRVAYNKKAGTTTWLYDDLDEEQKQVYLDGRKQEVKERYNFSAYILRNNYYKIVNQCLPEPKTAENPPKPQVVIPESVQTPEEPAQEGQTENAAE